MISDRHEHLGKVMVVIYSFLLKCMGLMIVMYIFQLSNFQLCINCNCLPFLFLCTLSPQKLKQVSLLSWARGSFESRTRKNPTVLFYGCALQAYSDHFL